MGNKKFILFGRQAEMTGREVEDINRRFLSNYVYLQEALKTATEEECHKALCLEKTGKQRDSILYRLHAKFTELRAKNERQLHNIKRK